jgi:probable F420-dependent oxidoreductase
VLIGIGLPSDIELALDVARAAEDVGCESLWASDHLYWPASFEARYPYRESGLPPLSAETPWPDPWCWLSAVAAVTREVRLGTAVYQLPLRDPMVTARAVATVDLISGGRVILGVGLGWMAEEFELAGLDFHSRAHRAEEITALLRKLWSERVVSFDGDTIHLRPVTFEPKPPQRATLPIYFGGETRAALRRAVTLGNGWLGIRHTPASVAHIIGEIERLRLEQGCEGESFSITVGAPWPLSAAEVAEYQRLGVERLILRPARAGGDWLAGMRDIGYLINHTSQELDTR